ncbi:MAG: hypothetical protein R6U39_02030 [Candidatus Aegiribacteria sp.]
MRYIAPAAILALLLITALVAREFSTGGQITATGGEYLELLAAGDTEGAFALLSDSLAGLVSPSVLESLAGDSPPEGIRTGAMDKRGFTLSVRSSDGGSRIIWLRQSREGDWRVSGDSSLDNLLGSASLLCISFARDSVIPDIYRGIDPGGHSCPVSGRSYYLQDGKLFCPAGHLGDGLETGGVACARLRDSLAATVEEYLSEGYEYPSGFQEMYLQSAGDFGQSGGFRCPDQGYAYYRITREGVYCPFHDRTSPVLTPGTDTSEADGE